MTPLSFAHCGVLVLALAGCGASAAERAESTPATGDNVTASKPSAGTLFKPDLVPIFRGKLLRHLKPYSRRIDDSFCAGLPTPSNPVLSANGQITVAGLSWGVRNIGTSQAVGRFRIALFDSKTGQPLATHSLSGLAAGQTNSASFVRPQSTTWVIRIDSNSLDADKYGGTGCFQALMQASNAMNWQDPPYRVRVDVDGSVAEVSESNNESTH
jgi:hypothetical protein